MLHPLNRRHQTHRGVRGQTSVEFALVLVVFLTLVLGLVDVGRAVMLYNTVATAAEEGARFGVVLRDSTWGTAPFASDKDGNTPNSYVGITTYLQTSYENTIVGQVARRCRALDAGKTTVTIGVYRSGVSPTPTPTTSPGRGGELWVTVGYPFEPVAGRLLHIGSFPVFATAKMFIE